MSWHCLPCDGHSGGMLLGFDKDIAHVINEDNGEFFQSVDLALNADDFKWTLINVYGPAHDERKLEFLSEI